MGPQMQSKVDVGSHFLVAGVQLDPIAEAFHVLKQKRYTISPQRPRVSAVGMQSAANW